MEKYFVNYELALRMKALGFDEPCFAFYQKEYTETRPIMVDDSEQYRLTGYRTCRNSEIPKHYVSAPTFSQCFRWFREKHRIITEITFYNNGEEWEETEFKATVNRFEDFTTHNTFIKIDIKSYEDAELYCLEKLIEIVESKLE